MTDAATVPVIDSDQHLYETRTTWLDHIDPAHRDDALRIVDDELGYPWLTWGERKLGPVDVQYPGQTSELGDRRERIRAGLPAENRYDEVLPRIEAEKNKLTLESSQAKYTQLKETFALKRKAAEAEARILEVRRDRSALAMRQA